MLKVIEFKRQFFELYGKFAEDTGAPIPGAVKKANAAQAEREAAAAEGRPPYSSLVRVTLG